MKSKLAVCVLSLALTLPASAQVFRSIVSTAAGSAMIYLGVASVVVAPLAGGSAGVTSVVVGYAGAGTGAYALIKGISGLLKASMALHRGVAQESQLRDELPGLLADMEAGRINALDDIQQLSWRSYLEDLKNEEMIQNQVLEEVEGDADFEQKLIAVAVADMVK